MEKRFFVVATLLAAVLLTVALSPLSGQQGSNYDPWLDYNGDGRVDVSDLQALGQTYGGMGDSTKNVNVTNWPIQREMFSENLVLRGAFCWRGEFRELFDASTAPSPHFKSGPYGDYVISTLIDSTPTLMYNETFIYQKPALNPYRILGMPIVSLVWNITNSPSATFGLDVWVYLGKIYLNGAWTELAALGHKWEAFLGQNTNIQSGWAFETSGLVNSGMYANERLAVRIQVYGSNYSVDSTEVFLNLMMGTDSDYFTVNIPVAESP